MSQNKPHDYLLFPYILFTKQILVLDVTRIILFYSPSVSDSDIYICSVPLDAKK